MARNMAHPSTAAPSEAAPQHKDEQVTVLNPNTVPVEVDLSPKGRTLNPELGMPVDRASINPDEAAPIVRDARAGAPARPGNSMAVPAPAALAATDPGAGAALEEQPKVRRYRVEKEKAIVDRTSGARTRLREGKEISAAQYDIRDLQRQGVQLRDITDLDPNEPL
jgi:hypothetical protein